MSIFTSKHILLGVTGSIAAYKAADLASKLTQAGALVDVILTPTTAVPAPEIKKGALPDGDSDLSTTIEIMRFVTAGNMTGLPAISFPVGYTQKGLPIGLQVMGKAWDESTLLRMALAAEQVVERKAPQVHFKIM